MAEEKKEEEMFSVVEVATQTAPMLRDNKADKVISDIEFQKEVLERLERIEKQIR